MSSFTVQTFSNSAGATPAGVGQLGIQNNGTNVVPYLSVGTSIGSWSPVALGLAVNVKNFVCSDGLYVQGDGSHDDTSGIQAALDYISGQDVFDPTVSVGGTLYFPKGAYKTTGELAVVGGQQLIGDGYNASVIQATLPATNSAALRLTQQNTNTAEISNVLVSSIGFNTNKGYGIASVGGDIVGCRFDNLLFATGNYGIHLNGDSGAFCISTRFQDLKFHVTGGGIIAVEGISFVVDGVEVEGGVRGDFVRPPGVYHPLIDVRGGGWQVRNIQVEPGNFGTNTITPLYLGPGGGTVENAHFEIADASWLLNGHMIVLDTTTGVRLIDVSYLDGSRNIYVANSTDVYIDRLDSSATVEEVGNLIRFGDATSTVQIRNLVGSFDTGDLDNPQIKVYSGRAIRCATPYFSELLHAPRTRNILPNGDFERGTFGWNIINAGGKADITIEVVNDPDSLGKALKIDFPTGVGLTGFALVSAAISLPTNRAGWSGSPGFFGVNVKPTTGFNPYLVIPQSPSNNANRTTTGFIIAKSTSIQDGDQMEIQISGTTNAGSVYLRQAHCVLGNVYNYEPTPMESQVWVSTSNVYVQGTAAASAGTWKPGDIIFNSAPTAGASIGWVCVAGGSPGTWKAFGAIDS